MRRRGRPEWRGGQVTVLVRHVGPVRRVVLPGTEAERVARLRRVGDGTGPLSDLVLARSALEAAQVHAERARALAAERRHALVGGLLAGLGALCLLAVVTIIAYAALSPLLSR